MHGSHGNRLDHLLMWLDYLVPGEVWISIEEYLRGLLDDFPEEITEFPETLTATNLFTMRDKTKRELL